MITTCNPSQNYDNNYIIFPLDQLCPTRGPVEGFVWPSLGVCCSESILHTDNLSLFS